ncbi:Pappalysin-1 [Mizuhopecten yessoensis]|uniref:Pappalysin-1 n=1 Tax=Mizuhopecten yessoensis TaxID=6573 RepID=A0A210QKT2_MIZYE|nr:Pappalysin-1 [Mizuhopecten yessoensis]
MFKCNRALNRWKKNFTICNFIFLVICEWCNGTSSINAGDVLIRKQLLQTANIKSLSGNPSTCTRSKRTAEYHHPLHRHPRDISMERGSPMGGDALYFSGRELLRLKMTRKKVEMDLPRGNFTVELWIKPEGGQHDPVTILGLVDICNGNLPSSEWSIGITSSLEDTFPRPKLFVSLRSQRSQYSSTLEANTHYVPNRWHHIALSYDGETIKFYINGAMIAAGKDQRGNIFSKTSKKCKEIHIGGEVESGLFFRGAVDDLRIWNYTVPHEKIVQNLYGITDARDKHYLVFHDNFDNIKRWRKLSKRMPSLIPADLTSAKFEDISIEKPACGESVCDNAELVRSYLDNDQLRNMKEVRYRVINVMSNDGTDPVVTQEQIRNQHRLLVEAFSPYNITWQLEERNIRNSSLRLKTVLFACNPRDVGNAICDPECSHSRTGNDGGDCEPFLPQCDSLNIQNGRCDFECNKEYHRWDGGDCCIPGPNTHLSCFDPTSPYRGYIGINEFKEAIGLDGSSHLNIYFVSQSTNQLVGLATMPWDKEVYSIQGGVVVHPKDFGVLGRAKNLIHELGHVLGLWHVHHGVSEMDCSDSCLETEPSIELGDLCSDTMPTPNNTACRDPDWAQQSCGIPAFTDTPYANYMGYGDDACIDHFTPQQTARMHCYLDLVYQPWTTANTPAPVPLPPRVLSSGTDTVTLGWIAPFGSHTSVVTSLCDICTDADAVIQFATNSSSSHPSPEDFDFAPKQAEGHPDADKCDLSVYAWMPDTIAGPSDCRPNDCFIDLGFTFPVIPNRISIWVVWNAKDGIHDVKLYHVDGDVTSLGPYSGYCDTVLSIGVDVTKPVSKVRLYTANPYVAIDAVQMRTANDYRGCAACRNRRYRVTREPPFSEGPTKQTKRPQYVDRGVETGQTYTYHVRVQTQSGGESVQSPSLVYTHGQTFCGDGNVDPENGEECDDGNLLGGDGCDVNCHVEKLFYCEGNPSTCFLHDGDGICQDFERNTSVRDCGFFTPDGFEDQWVMSAVANPTYQAPGCPATLLTGSPSQNSVCAPSVPWDEAWFPCGHRYDTGSYWIEAYFAKAVVAAAVLIHLGSDGKSKQDSTDPRIRVELVSANNASKPLSVHSRNVNCRQNPVTIHITQDLSLPFELTIGVRIFFASRNVSFAGIRLRSPRYWNPIQLASCTDNQVYNQKSGRCIPKACSTTCSVLRVHDGRARCSGYREGDQCSISCNVGYEVVGVLNEYTCVNGTWHSVAPLDCLPVDCAEPEIPFASVICPEGTLYGRLCTFKCMSPAKQKGVGNTITCEADGRWSSPLAFCQVQCSSPMSLVSNAKLVTKSCKLGLQSVGKRCKFKCFRNYHMEGRKASRRTVVMRCDEEGIWHGGQCERITCPPIDPVFTGLYTCTDIMFMGSACTLRCPDGERPQMIKCMKSGQWSGSFAMCPSGMYGECPEVLEHDGLVFNCNSNYIGYQCSVSCLLPDFRPILNGRTNSVRGQLVHPGMISKDIPVRQLTCTALVEWYPDPNNLRCLEMCKEDAIQDGFCDCINNRKRCAWDGGDCCKSTSITNMVMTFPDHSADDCSCKDPNAIENKKKKSKKRRKRPKKSRQRRRRKKNKSVETDITFQRFNGMEG